jgi:hypothetical protein
MSDENNTEETSRNGRRSTDDTTTEGIFPQSSGTFRNRLFSGFLALGGVAALVGIGRASHTLDTAVATNIKQDTKIEQMYDRLTKNDIEQNRLLVVLENNVILQKSYEQKILDKLDNTKDQLNNINNGVRGNREAIIIMNGKVTYRDNTRVKYLASR